MDQETIDELLEETSNSNSSEKMIMGLIGLGANPMNLISPGKFMKFLAMKDLDKVFGNIIETYPKLIDEDLMFYLFDNGKIKILKDLTEIIPDVVLSMSKNQPNPILNYFKAKPLKTILELFDVEILEIFFPNFWNIEDLYESIYGPQNLIQVLGSKIKIIGHQNMIKYFKIIKSLGNLGLTVEDTDLEKIILEINRKNSQGTAIHVKMMSPDGQKVSYSSANCPVSMKGPFWGPTSEKDVIDLIFEIKISKNARNKIISQIEYQKKSISISLHNLTCFHMYILKKEKEELEEEVISLKSQIESLYVALEYKPGNDEESKAHSMFDEVIEDLLLQSKINNQSE